MKALAVQPSYLAEHTPLLDNCADMAGCFVLLDAAANSGVADLYILEVHNESSHGEEDQLRPDVQLQPSVLFYCTLGLEQTWHFGYAHVGDRKDTDGFVEFDAGADATADADIDTDADADAEKDAERAFRPETAVVSATQAMLSWVVMGTRESLARPDDKTTVDDALEVVEYGSEPD